MPAIEAGTGSASEATAHAPSTINTYPGQTVLRRGEKPVGPVPGEIWGDIEFGPMLGQGGMGAVFKGRQISLDRTVAVKILPTNLSEDPAFRERFMVEARSVARLNSAHIVQVFFAGVHQGRHYFAMEYVEGEDLGKRIRQGGKPEQRVALDFMLQAAKGLAAAYELGVIHRDIKPSNLMVTGKNVLKIMDFGLARLSGATGHALTMTGTVMGTVSYFSPEQGRGERCDCRTDIYALGVTMFEVLTGALPFSGENPSAIIYQHIHVPPPLATLVQANLPPDIQAVVLKCLTKNPADRYPTPNELVKDLEALLAGRPISIPPAESKLLRAGSQAAKTGGSGNQGLLIGGGLVILAASIIAAAIVLPKLGSTPAQPATPAVQPAPVADGKPAQPTVTATTPTTPALPTPPAVPAIPAAPSDDPAMTAALAGINALASSGHFADARAQLATARLKSPGDARWNAQAAAIDQAEAHQLLTAATTALGAGDVETADPLILQAANLKGDAAELATVQRRRDDLKTTAAQYLTTAKTALANNDLSGAELAVALANRVIPKNPEAAAVTAAIAAARDRMSALRQQADTLVATGRQALAQGDEAAAAVNAKKALELDADSAAAKKLADDAANLGSDLIRRAEVVRQAVAARNEDQAVAALASMNAVGKASAITTAAANSVARLRAELASERQAQEATKLALNTKAQALAKRLDDLKEPVADLDAAVAAYLKEAGNGSEENSVITRKLEDRHSRAAVTTSLATLDGAVVQGKPVDTVVDDKVFAGQLAALAKYPGLVFTSSLDSFTRSGDQATGQLSVRHALAVYPARTLTYQVNLVRQNNQWRITDARLQR